MRILCLLPTYNRPQLVANAIACFRAQDYPEQNRQLLILDDAGQLATHHAGSWDIVSTATRYPSLTAKYNGMLALDRTFGGERWLFPCGETDAVALMDDDDIYGPQWLSSHAKALTTHRWSHPREVWTTYRGIARSPTEPGREPAGGRFWAAAAVRVDLLRELGGFQEITRPTFDQEHLRLWQEHGGDPGRPDALPPHSALPQYCYGWGRAPRHVSLEMPDRQNWYANYATRLGPLPAAEPLTLDPAFDEQTRAIYRHCWGWN